MRTGGHKTLESETVDVQTCETLLRTWLDLVDAGVRVGWIEGKLWCAGEGLEQVRWVGR